MSEQMEQVTSDIALKLSDTDYLTFLANSTFNKGVSLALWRLPNDAIKHLIISKTHLPLRAENNLEELPKGFLFAPFSKIKPTLFLPADFIFHFSNGELKRPETPQEEASITWMKDLRLKDQTPAKRTFHSPPAKKTGIIDKADFLQTVEAGIREIENGRFEKIVPSRKMRVELSDDFDVIQAFQKLCDRYPNALVSWVSIPGIGDWLGATPETLVSVQGRTIFKTVALAGTQAYQEGTSLKSIAWTQKEIEEQALVSRYIVSCFKKIRLREFEEHGPKTVVAGNLMHLRTDFSVDMKATNFPQLGSVMLHLLHPTSAVCGMPLEPAIDFLQQLEGYDREFYAGYLGPVNMNDSIDLFVNIRCMQILKNEGILYAGAGVTVDSVPEKEWQETEIKFETLLKAIF